MVTIISYVWLVTLIGVLILQVYRLIKRIPTIFTYADLIVSIVGIIGCILAIMNKNIGKRLLLFISGSFFGITVVSLTYRFTNDLISPIVYGVSYILFLSIVTALYILRRM